MANAPVRHGKSVTAKSGGQSRPQIQVTGSELYEGPIPPPELLARFDDIAAGTGKRIIDQFMDEGVHRRQLELMTVQANVDAQAATTQLNAYQARSVVRSDLLGQILSTLVCLVCIAGAVWLAILGHYWVAALLAALPTATLVKSFFVSSAKG